MAKSSGERAAWWASFGHQPGGGGGDVLLQHFGRGKIADCGEFVTLHGDKFFGSGEAG